jgi:hypothetical protein
MIAGGCRARYVLPVVLVAVAASAAACSSNSSVTSSHTSTSTRPQTPKWKFAAPMPQRRSYMAAAKIQNHLYVAGGMFGPTGVALEQFTRYDPVGNRWQTLPNLPVPVRAAKGGAIGDTMYVTGGLDSHGTSDRVLAFNIHQGRWVPRAPLPEPRYDEAVATLGGRLYVIGGSSNGTSHRDVFAYTPSSNHWDRVAPLPRANHTMAAVAFHGEIWVVGGRWQNHPISDVWIYNPGSHRWRRGPSMPKPEELDGVAADGDQIHAIWQDVYQTYDSRTGRWSQGPAPIIPRHAQSAFTVHGTLYSLGGCTIDLQDSPDVERLSLR